MPSLASKKSRDILDFLNLVQGYTMFKVIFSLLFTVIMASSAELTPQTSCAFTQEGGLVVSFEAYKTPQKLGVKGGFDSVNFTPAAHNGSSFDDIFMGSTVSIDTRSVNSNNKERDAKLIKFFFDNLSSGVIRAKIVYIKSDTTEEDRPKTGALKVTIEMNGVTKEIEMKYNYSAGIFTAVGSIDMLDFGANKALSAINQACYDLHKGKTWSDVAIGFSTKVKYELCYVKK